MANTKMIMFVTFIFIGCTLVARMMEGAYFGSEDTDILNYLSVFRTQEILGLFSVPVFNLNFFTEGIPHLILWDYPFFGGTYSIFKYFLYTISIGLVFGIGIIFVGMLSQFWGR